MDRTPVCFKTKFEDEVVDFAYDFSLLHIFIVFPFSGHPPFHYCMSVLSSEDECLRPSRFETCNSEQILDRYVSI